MVLTEYGALMVRRLIFWNYMHVVNVHYFTVRVISLKSQWNYNDMQAQRSAKCGGMKVATHKSILSYRQL